MKIITIIILTLISFSMFGQYEIKGDTIIIVETGYYRYFSDSLYLDPQTEKEQIIEAISNSIDIIFLMRKYIEVCDTINGGYKLYQYENTYGRKYIVREKFINPTFEGFYEWIKEQYNN